METTHRMNLSSRLKEIFLRAAGEAEITQSTRPEFGDYQYNSALKIAQKAKRNPREVAEEIVGRVQDPTGLIEKMEVKGPGFINIFVNKGQVGVELVEILVDERLGVPIPPKRERIICEFSSPNIAKAMHVGHLRSTIIGDSIARLMEFLGHDVIRLNHVGDWGTQFGMLITYIKTYHPEIVKDASGAELEQLMEWYKKSKGEFDASATFKQKSQEEVVRLQGGDETSKIVWEHICEISRRAFHEIYDLLDVHLQERGESFYNPYLEGVIRDFEEKGLVTVDDGAKCVFLEGFKNKEGEALPIIIQKRDGGFNYSTTDLAGFKYRVQHDKADRIIIVTDSGQSMHFQMVYSAATKVGYINPDKVRFDHVPFGLVLSAEGKKFKTREGETVRLSELLQEAIDEAKVLLQDRNMPDLDEAARILGIGAVKYADLSSNRIKDYTFSYERMLKFEGNTAAYILYSYVRIQSIKKKAECSIDEIKGHPIELLHPSEVALGLALRRFGEALAFMDEELLPNRLTDYLYHLAECFHTFFRDCHVIGSEKQNSRLLLCELTARIIKRGLYILGIETLEQM